MSFSEKIKSEIINSKIKKCCMLALRYGELSTESKDVNISDITKYLTKNCCKKSYIKGLFLGSGCVADPNKEYHFEINVKKRQIAEYVVKLLAEFMIEAKYIKRLTNTYVVYIKDSEKISTVLAILEANNSILEYENVRIEKEIKNDVNRNVNCETANISKTIDSAYKQTLAIEKIIKNRSKYTTLNDDLKKLCSLRLKNQNDSLDELKLKYHKPISKSGIYHKLQKIIKIAKEI